MDGRGKRARSLPDQGDMEHQVPDNTSTKAETQHLKEPCRKLHRISEKQAHRQSVMETTANDPVDALTDAL